MTNKKITDFATGPALTGNEFFPIAIGNKNYKYDLNFISTWFSGKPTAYNFGALADDPTVSPFDGGPIPLGAQYYNTTLNAIRAYGDSGWFTPNLDAAIFAEVTGAQLVGTPEGTVQDALDGRPTSVALAAPTGASEVGNSTIRYDSLDLLKAAGVPRTPGKSAIVNGGGKYAVFDWVADSAAVGNDITVVNPAGNPGSGRWVIAGPIYSEVFGVYDGMPEALATTRINAILAALRDKDGVVLTYTGNVNDRLRINAKHDITLTFRGTITQTGASKQTVNFLNCERPVVYRPRLVGRGTEYNGASTSWNGVAGLYFDGCTDCEVHFPVLSNHAGGGIRWNNIIGLKIFYPKIVGIGGTKIAAGENGSDFAIGAVGFSPVSKGIYIYNPDLSGHAFGCGWGIGSDETGELTGGVYDYYIHDIPGQHGFYFSGVSVAIGDGLVKNCALAGVKNQSAGAGMVTGHVSIGNLVAENCGSQALLITALNAATGARFSSVSIASVTAENCGSISLIGVTQCDIGNVTIRNGTNMGFDARYSNVKLSKLTTSLTQGAGHYQSNSVVQIGDVEIVDAALNVLAAGGNNNLNYLVAEGAGSFENTGSMVLRTVGAVPSTLAHAVLMDVAVDCRFGDLTNDTTKVVRWNPAVLKSLRSYSGVGGFWSAAMSNPSTPVRGRRQREMWGNQSPAAAGSTDPYLQGDFCHNTASVAVVNGHLLTGWICRVAGSPGTWEPVYVKVTTV